MIALIKILIFFIFLLMKLVISIYSQISFFGLIKGTTDYAKMVFLLSLFGLFIYNIV